MATSLQTELNAKHQTCAEDADDDVDCEAGGEDGAARGYRLHQSGLFHFGCFYLLVFSLFSFFVADCRLSPGQMAVGADE